MLCLQNSLRMRNAKDSKQKHLKSPDLTKESTLNTMEIVHPKAFTLWHPKQRELKFGMQIYMIERFIY